MSIAAEQIRNGIKAELGLQRYTLNQAVIRANQEIFVENCIGHADMKPITYSVISRFMAGCDNIKLANLDSFCRYGLDKNLDQVLRRGKSK